MRECLELAKELCKWTKLHKLQGGVNHTNVNLAKTHNEKINNFQVDDLMLQMTLLQKIWIFMMNVHENPHHDWLLDLGTSTHNIGNHKALGAVKNIGSKIIIKIVGGHTHLAISKTHVLFDFDEPIKKYVLCVPGIKKYSLYGLFCWSKFVGSF